MECVDVIGRWGWYTATASAVSAANIIISSISSRLQVQGH